MMPAAQARRMERGADPQYFAASLTLSHLWLIGIMI